jgi:hypothetical protein
MYNSSVFAVDSKPYGFTYGEWAAKWFKWLLEIPNENNPANDNTGKNCAVNQRDPNVWFLAGTPGGPPAVRTCTIPPEKAILFPIISNECSFSEYPKLKTESELRIEVKSQEDQVTNLRVTIDGIEMQNLDKYRIQSPLFNVTFPQDNIFGAPAGPTQAVSDGYWVFLKPLPPGKHEIHFSGFCNVGTINTEAIYSITMKD